MSINNIANTVFPNTLSGLESLNVTNITINGFDVTTLFVPYTGANTNVDLNNKNLASVNNVGTTTLTATGLVQGGNLTTTGLTTTNTLKINSVPAGTQVNLLAYDATGNVIQGTVTTPVPSQFNITTTTGLGQYYIPLISTLSGATPIYGDQTGTIYYNNNTQKLTVGKIQLLALGAGTQTGILAYDSAYNVIQGSIPVPTQLLTTAISSGTNYYLPMVDSGSTGNQSYFSSTSFEYNYPTNTFLVTGTLQIGNNIVLGGSTSTTFSSLPSLLTPTFALGVNASNQLVRFATTNQIALTAVLANNNYNLVFTNSNVATSNAILSIDDGLNITYNPSTDMLTVPNLTVGSSASIVGYATLASPALTGTPTAPTAAPGTNTTQIATTAFVIANSGSGFLPLTGGTMTGSITYANTALTPITLSSANLTAYTYSIRDSFWTLPMLEFTTKTLSTFGSVSIGVPIVITNTSTTNLMSLPFNASTSYSKSISNTGGDIFITFAGRTTAPVASGTVVFGNSIPVAINDTLSMNPAAAGILCNTYQNVSNAALQIQGFWSGANSGIRFDANATNSTTLSALWGTVNNTGWTFYNGNTTSVVIGKITEDNIGWRLGSMVDFSTAITWDASNSLYVTTGGIGGTNSGVGIGFNTTLDSGLLVCIAPNVAWKNMTYKALTHTFATNGNTTSFVIAPTVLTSYAQGLYFDATVANPYVQFGTGNYVAKASNAGAFINDAVTGDLILNSRTGNVRIAGGSQFAQTTCTINATGIMFGNTGYGVRTVSGASYGCVSAYGLGLNGWNGYDLNNRYTFMSDIHNSGSTVGIHDNVYSWLWRSVAGTMYYDRPTQVYTNVPQQSYQPYQVLIGSNNNALQWGVIYSSFYKNNNVSWNAGVAISYFYKASATAVLRCSGAGSYYVTGAAGYNTAVNFYNTDTATAYILNFTQFTNNAYNHVSFPIMAQYAGLPVGNYAIIVSTNGTTDGNDHLYLLSEICFA